jgi:glycosyltransferase involved in cell wall biosynthesis
MHRILLATYAYPPSVGGVERQSQLLARALVERGHAVHVVTAARGDAPMREVDGGVEITRVAAGHGSRWRRMATYLGSVTAAVIRLRDRIDLVQVQQALYPAAALTPIARALGKPVIVRNSGSGVHGAVQLMSRLPLGRQGLAVIGRLATTVSLSAEMSTEMAGAGFRRVIEIPNGVVMPRVLDRAAARKMLGLPARGPIALFAGRLDREKGTQLLAQAWRLVDAPDALLVVAGNGPERVLLTDVPRTRLVGMVDNLDEYFAAADVFVLPSESEGISNALLEAMAAGRPVVATDIGGNRAVISSSAVGLLTPPDDAAALARAVTGLLRDPDRATALGLSGRENVAAFWSFKAMVDAYERLYDSVVAGRA